jgi:GntR family transcriptional regulator
VDIQLSPNTGVPVYLQIVQQIKQLIATGRLQAQDELLPIRQLAEVLLINPNTVARAYRELEQETWVYKRRGAGTFVSEQVADVAVDKSRLHQQIDDLLAEASHVNCSMAELINLIKQRSK